ncbi:MAG: hypothetical protein A2790_05660 [Phenylobacterium sp. RIFCSPHIGHO2_01_FULL_69_31]|jgi:hypothetical protein|uniref:hypothetical protein n=1 Tax=Phenylobacterium sp. RIFCSPHIGHO2_01_FULL_69_31 TaxID=1801944 RepID=UPI0008AB5319|nr:hypothetical protein [Phenylobacterium sp. RIFCSPHIGHO2_01_FULL_69_31]OHB30295.1 MAG: hypothetical protein A2790_05660 [Phenylobacterium sp. RIFCSPHIGHO2_01_FULL_69_31]
MVSLDDYIDDDGDEPDTAADFAALKGCLKALADAIASTNLAVINGAQGDVGAATQRVQASIGALKRFHDAFKILEAGTEDESEAPAEEEDDA